MKQYAWLIAVLTTCLLTAGLSGQVSSGPAGEAQAAALWQQMRRVDVDSADFTVARLKLKSLIAQMDAQAKLEAMAAMMDGAAEPGTNEAAVAMFGQSPLNAAELRELLFAPKPTGPQRTLLVAYYNSACAGSLADAAARSAMLDLLAERLDASAGEPIGYGQQRLLVRVCQAALRCCAAKAQPPAEADALIRAMRKYAKDAPAGDVLGASCKGWVRLQESPITLVDTVPMAIDALGHWDPLVRYRAGRFLAGPVAASRDVLLKVWGTLRDPRDEVRSAAILVFAISPQAGGQAVVPQMTAFMLRDRNVGVQQAAAEVIIARADQAAGAIEPLLSALTDGRPGPKRATSMLRALAALASQASDVQREKMLSAAMARLSSSPRGSLPVLKALGVGDAEVARALKSYRKLAYRDDRFFIDRHVLPVILDARRAE